MEYSDGRYPGGKSLAGVHQWIASLMPAHVWYAEPFAGKGGVLRRKVPALRSFLVDRCPDVVAWWERLAMPGVRVHQGDGIRWLELAAEWAPPDLLVYVDPPYLLETRTGGRRYRHELEREDHVRLLAAVSAVPAAVLISGYPSALYDETLAGWDRHEREVITRGGVMRTEVVWRNAAAGIAGGDVGLGYGELGGTFRERERVARKVKRWADRVAALPAVEQRAVVLGVLDAVRAVKHRRK